MGSRTRSPASWQLNRIGPERGFTGMPSWKRSLNDAPSDQTPKRLSLESIPQDLVIKPRGQHAEEQHQRNEPAF